MKEIIKFSIEYKYNIFYAFYWKLSLSLCLFLVYN